MNIFFAFSSPYLSANPLKSLDGLMPVSIPHLGIYPVFSQSSEKSIDAIHRSSSSFSGRGLVRTFCFFCSANDTVILSFVSSVVITVSSSPVSADENSRSIFVFG